MLFFLYSIFCCAISDCLDTPIYPEYAFMIWVGCFLAFQAEDGWNLLVVEDDVQFSNRFYWWVSNMVRNIEKNMTSKSYVISVFVPYGEHYRP